MDRKAYQKAYKQDYRSQMRSVTLTIPVADHRRLVKTAQSHGKKPTTLLYELAFAQFDASVYVPPALDGELKQIKFLIRNIANNLNQIAHHTNTVKRAADAGHVFAELKRLELCVEEYTRGRLKARHDHQVDEP